MVYLRIKKIQNKEYAYLVKSIKTEKGPRQKVLRYLGKVQRHILPEKFDKEIKKSGKKDFIRSLAQSHLNALGFSKMKGVIRKGPLIFSPKDYSLHSEKSQKEYILAFEQGYLCKYTLQRLLSFTKSDDVQQDGYTLARYFLEAGLRITEEEFVQFYSLL
ncbi:hypothetical protein HY495_03995 [Candidatus Woesearchaeota archaeon]|nr:hypothetical protein [Candidatus Woesearchaeota archaeon]